jgi:hypothetical protein
MAEGGHAKSQLPADRDGCAIGMPYIRIISVRILICINKKFDPNQSFGAKPVSGSRLF